MIPSPASPTSTQAIDPDYAAELRRRAQDLQTGATRVVANLRILDMLRTLGDAAQLGSSVSGLMVWRDIDFTVPSPGVTPDRIWNALKPLLTDPRLVSFVYREMTGPRNPSGNPSFDRYYLVAHVEATPGSLWKIDISVWLAELPNDQVAETEKMRRRLTAETRLAILWIKDQWRGRPEYPLQVGGIDIYRAVLDHGVRTPAEFETYLAVRSHAAG